MRRLVVAMLVVLLALGLVGCGGGGEEPEAPAEDAAAPAATPPPATGKDAPPPIADRSPGASADPKPFVVDESTPAEVKSRVESKQAMVIAFVDSDQGATDDLRSQITSAVAPNRGKVDLLTYDLGKFATIDASGVVQVDERGLAKDPKAQGAAVFSKALGVTHLPTLFVIDDQGMVVFTMRGYVDAELLERQVARASR